MNVVMVIAQQNFRDEELFHTKEELEKTGNEVVVASIERGTCKGMLGGTANAEININEINESDFNAIVFVGGGGASVYFNNSKAHELAQAFNKSGKITAAICIAPSILANAGILDGKKATAWDSEKGNLAMKGAVFTGEPLTIDGNIITANGPKAARAFGKKIAENL